MLYKETVTPTTLGLLTKLMSDADLASFYLVGGTSMALQVGHRISVDLDLFTSSSTGLDKFLSVLFFQLIFLLTLLLSFLNNP